MHFLLRLRGLLVVPVLARQLGPEGLGVLTLASAVVAPAATLLGLGLHTGLSVQLVSERDPLRHVQAWGSGLRLIGAFAVLGSLALVASLAGGIGGPALHPLRPYASALGILLAANTLRELATLIPQLRQETRFIAAFNLSVEYGGALLGVGLALMGRGAGGVLWATALVLAGGVLFALARTARSQGSGTGIDRVAIRNALAVGLPVLPIGLGQWALQSADNFFLAAWHGEATLGKYGVAYTLASIVLIVLAAVNLVYFPTASALWQRGPDRLVGFLERSYRLISTTLGFFVVGAFLVCEWGVALLAGSRYSESAPILPWIVLAYALFTVLQLLQFVPIVVAGRTTGIALAYVAMLGLNLLLNILLIPDWGMRGAAAATVLSYAAGIGFLARLVRRALPGFRWTSPVLRGVAPAVVLAVPAWIFSLSAKAPAAQAAVGVALLGVAYAALAHAFGSVRSADWRLALGGTSAGLAKPGGS